MHNSSKARADGSRRVVITGMGAITPLGQDPETTLDNLVAGRSGVDFITSFDASRFPTKFAAQVKNFELARHVPDAGRFQACGANTRFALAAARQAIADAGLLDAAKVDPTRFGIYLGAGEGAHEFHELVSLIGGTYRPDKRTLDTAAFAQRAIAEWHAAGQYEQELHTMVAHLAEEYGLEGPNLTCLTACAASSQAIGEATCLIRHGDADLMLSGGGHSMIHPLGMTGFNRLTALSTNNANPKGASRPFDLNRDGFVLGEGAGMMVLEEYEHAKRRGAKIYAEVTGYGSTADAFRVTDSHPDGRGAIACIRDALRDSRLDPSAIGYVNAHGTSTEVNDRVESLAIKKVLGEGVYQVPVSSSKSMLGHLIAAAGAVELIVCVLSMRRGVIHPTLNYETPDPECDLDYVPRCAREKRFDHALSNSFGFGGQNISLIVSRV